MPTWHQLFPAPPSTPQDNRIISDESFDSTLRLYKSAPFLKSNLTPPPEGIDKSLYLVGTVYSNRAKSEVTRSDFGIFFRHLNIQKAFI